MGILNSTHGKGIITCHDRVKLQPLSVKGQKKFLSGRYILGTLTDQFITGFHAICLQGILVTFQLVDPAVGIAGVKIEDTFPARLQKLGSGAVHGCMVVAYRAVYIIPFQVSVNQHDGKF